MEAGRVRESWRALHSVFANPNLRALQTAFAGSVVGDWAFAVATSVYAYEQGGATAVGVLGVARYLSMAILGPLAATLPDRYSRRRVMVAADLMRLVLVLGGAWCIAADGPAVIVYGVAIVTSVVGTAFRPAQAAILPSLASNPGELTTANVASSTIESVGFFLGPAVAGVMLAVTSASVQTVYVFDAATFLWSALLLARIPVPAVAAATSDEDRDDESMIAQAAAGFREIRRSGDLRVIVALYTVQTLVAGASLVFTVVIALDLLDLGSSGLGWLDAALGVGGLIGGAIALMLAQRGRLAQDFAAGVLLWGMPLAIIAVSPTVTAAVIAMVLVGVGNSLVDVNAITLIQRMTPDDILARVFGAVDSVLIGAMAVGSLVTPALVSAVGVRTTLALLAVGVTLPVLGAIRALQHIDARARPPEKAELLRRVPIFAPLPDSILDRLARALVEVSATAGEPIVRAGEEGDRYYVIEEGSVEVRGVVLGVGDGFGEVALLRDVPRTATVVARTDVVLQALERSDFLPAVTGFDESAAAAERVVAQRMSGLKI